MTMILQLMLARAVGGQPGRRSPSSQSLNSRSPKLTSSSILKPPSHHNHFLSDLLTHLPSRHLAPPLDLLRLLPSGLKLHRELPPHLLAMYPLLHLWLFKHLRSIGLR